MRYVRAALTVLLIIGTVLTYIRSSISIFDVFPTINDFSSRLGYQPVFIPEPKTIADVSDLWRGPGFNCHDKRAPLGLTEKTICDSDKLRLLDLENTKAYYRACGEHDKALQRDEGTWWQTTRDAGCKDDAACIEAAYRARIDVLKGKAREEC